MSDPFGDLDGALGESEDSAPGDPDQDVDDSAETETESSDEEAGGPAFPFSATTQRPLYARDESWDAFDDVLALDVERALREANVRDATKSELHDAALRVLAEHPEEIVHMVLSARGRDESE